MDFRLLLLNYRADNNLTQLELAKELGVERTTILDWEKGVKPRAVNEIKVRKKLEKGE